jgi:magnesium transporter
MFAGIFGMNMRSMLEASVLGFWGVSGAIVFGCLGIFLAVLAYMRMKRIL